MEPAAPVAPPALAVPPVPLPLVVDELVLPLDAPVAAVVVPGAAPAAPESVVVPWVDGGAPAENSTPQAASTVAATAAAHILVTSA
jgi:hypothetical protein